MRQLPEEHDSEQHPGALRQRVLGGGPADDRRQRAGDRPDDGGKRRPLFERRVDNRVAGERRECDRCAEEIDPRGKDQESEN